MSLALASVVVQLALLYAVVGYATTLSFRVVGFPDLTPDGSFVCGAALGSSLLLSGVGTGPALIAAAATGAVAGMITALLHTRLGVSKLLSGLLVALMLYSLSLRIMGTSNLSLLGTSTFIGSFMQRGGAMPVLACLLFAGLAFGLLRWLLATPAGLLLRAAGDSPTAMELSGFRLEPAQVAGLAISNAMAAGAGAIISQYQGFVDASMGAGLVIVTFATIVIGESLLRPSGMTALLLSPVVGGIVYQAIVGVALRAGFMPSDLKMIAAGLTLLAVAMARLPAVARRGDRQIGNRAI